MASENETVEDIVKEMLNLGLLDEKSIDKIPRSLQALGLRTYAARIKAAHQREAEEMKREVAELRECLVRRSSHLNAILQKALELRNDVPSELRKVMDECIVAEDKAIGFGVFSKKGTEDENK